MAKNVTYLLGAGASANAIPVVQSLKDRFKIFCAHLSDYLENKPKVSDLRNFKKRQQNLIENIDAHYTIDTYARKLYLQNPNLHTNSDYILLINYLSAYFLYEQLLIQKTEPSNNFIYSKLNSSIDAYSTEYRDSLKGIVKDFDYRYDSFFASVLDFDESKNIAMPTNINIISWNYDFQIEKAFMNFTNNTLDDAMCRLNVVGTPHATTEKDYSNSHVIKLNGTAGFAEGNKYDDVFDFSEHTLDKRAFEVFEEILFSSRSKYQNGIRFSWEESDYSKKSKEAAQQIIKSSDLIIIIGYSFPYFNRKTDRLIFKNALEKGGSKIYIQAPEKDINSIMKRFKGVFTGAIPEPFTEIDQFLIPNEMDLDEPGISVW